MDKAKMVCQEKAEQLKPWQEESCQPCPEGSLRRVQCRAKGFWLFTAQESRWFYDAIGTAQTPPGL